MDQIGVMSFDQRENFVGGSGDVLREIDLCPGKTGYILIPKTTGQDKRT